MPDTTTLTPATFGRLSRRDLDAALARVLALRCDVCRERVYDDEPGAGCACRRAAEPPSAA